MPRPLDGPQDENRLTPQRQDGNVGYGYQVRGWFLVMVPPQLILRPARFFLVLFSGQRSHCEVWRRCPVRCPWPQQTFFDSKTCSLGDFPPRFPGPGPSQVDRTSSCDRARDGRLGSRSPSFGLPCGVLPCLRSRFRAGASTSSLWFAPRSGLVSPCVHGANASDWVAAALSASPAVSSARAGAAPTTVNARGFDFPRVGVHGYARKSKRRNAGELLCRAAAGPNLRHGLVLGLPASLRDDRRALHPNSLGSDGWW